MLRNASTVHSFPFYNGLSQLGVVFVAFASCSRYSRVTLSMSLSKFKFAMRVVSIDEMFEHFFLSLCVTKSYLISIHTDLTKSHW